MKTCGGKRKPYRFYRKLNTFHVSTAYDSRFKSQVNDWIRFAIDRNVQQLYLSLRYTKNIHDTHEFVLEDDSFFINSHFTHLTLGGCSLNPAGPVAWNNLTTLSILNGTIDEDSITCILSGSSLLETLNFDNCYGYSSLNITSKSVKNLTLYVDDNHDGEFNNDDHIVDINAPYISSLTIKDDLLSWKILLRDVSSLVKAHLSHRSYNIRFDSHVNYWIRFVTDLNVQQLYLHLWYKKDDEDRFVLEDDNFFNNSHFTHLYLGGCIFNPTGPISWNNLTTLSISNGELDQDLIANILSGSPLLDTLKLIKCYGYSWLDITSKSVKNLVFDGYAAQDDEFGNLDHIIEINAPFITSLTIIGDLLLWKILLQNVSSLVKANLNYTKLGYDKTTQEEEREEMLKRFILRLHHVKELKIGISCYMAYSCLEAKGFVFPSNLKKIVKVTYPVYDTDPTELGDCCDNDSPGGDSSRVDLQSIAATLGHMQATQQVILSRLDALLYDRQRYQPLLERLTRIDARAAEVELAAYAPPQVLMTDQDAKQVGDEGDPAAELEVGTDDDDLQDDVGDVEADVWPEV